MGGLRRFPVNREASSFGNRHARTLSVAFRPDRLGALKKLGMTKTELAQQMGVSQDYIYRILNGRIAFPHARETIERMAGICRVDPYIFAEYREVDKNLGISARLVWQRLRETGMSRDDLFQAMGGRISRPYFNSILRGDQPFPTNRAYIQLFALALEMEERTYQLFFDVMMAAYGYTPHALAPAVLDPAKVLAFFLPQSAFAGDLDRALTRMGELGMGCPPIIQKPQKRSPNSSRAQAISRSV